MTLALMVSQGNNNHVLYLFEKTTSYEKEPYSWNENRPLDEIAQLPQRYEVLDKDDV